MTTMNVAAVTVMNTAKADAAAVKVTLTVAVVVDRTNFIAKSRASMEALKSANLLKSVTINALILGEKGVGKQTLAQHIITAPVVDATSFNELLALIETHSSLIVKNFHKITNYKKLKVALDVHKTRIIGTSNVMLSETLMDEFFSLKIVLPPLRERLEDVTALIEKFALEAQATFDGEASEMPILEEIVPDLSKNCYSLKRSVYNAYLMNSFGEAEILTMMERFLMQRIGGRNDYRDLLYLFDVPMIKSGYAKFGSQLAISEKFGLNRNTLRKKINDYKDQLKID
ncbi:Fis family transcriptional regulator [Sulfurospirillum sp. hDNRA2]|uniref:Fis family transcriptional regulator n=1 Tax=Sulfurospirillum sp. hDNRA2 TaxID=3237298 RepID=UPI0020B813A1|nr:Fis family transcriptional regulator [Sulfurospirillum sp. DNRA8]MCP3651957.1 Fis family transcriptional regulator [Sulfurospirillum sp. DNRA8]MCR1810804.1 Fis family transcriptional regulator [Sulfurospirillum sp. DNRA8]